MPSISKSLDIYQGYNFKKDRQSTVGFITKLKIDKDDLTADQSCKDPSNPETAKAAVCVLNGFQWDLGVTDAMYFSGQVTSKNRQKIAELLYKSLTNIEVDLQFEIYDYDPVAKKYFKMCHSNGKDLNTLIEKNGPELNLSIADDPSTEVQSPENFAFQIGAKPQPKEQTIEIAVSENGKITKPWGLKAD